MGLLYRANYNIYNDANFTDLHASYGELGKKFYVGVPVSIPNPSISETYIDSETTPDFFIPYLATWGEGAFLGHPYILGEVDNVQPSQFFPQGQHYFKYTGKYIEVEFSNGAKIQSIYPYGSSAFGELCNCYDSEGTLVYSNVWFKWIFGQDSNNFSACQALVTDTFSSTELTGNLYFFTVSSKYDGQRWRPIAKSSIVDSAEATRIKDFFNNNLTPLSSDPYSGFDPSTTGGGYGSAAGTSESVDFPSLPSLSAIDTGFVTIYTPTNAQMQNLAHYMWNANAQDLDFWRKLVADPMDLILGVNIIPLSPSVAGAKYVKVGAITTDVYMSYTSTQYVEIDCGSIDVSEVFNAYLDYDPYTKFEIYLPYCGTHPLIADELIGKTIHVKYHIDILSGSCVAYVKCGDSVLYEFSGNVCAQIPITSSQYGEMVRSAINIAASIGTMVATGGATAPMAVGTIATTATNSTALKPSVEKSGAMGGMSGQLAIQNPYLIVTRPRPCIPVDQNKLLGYPSYITKPLNQLSGLNKISDIHIENVPCSGDEIAELENILKGGVIF